MNFFKAICLAAPILSIAGSNYAGAMEPENFKTQIQSIHRQLDHLQQNLQSYVDSKVQNDLQADIGRLQADIRQLQADNAELKRENDRLRDALASNSSNGRDFCEKLEDLFKGTLSTEGNEYRWEGYEREYPETFFERVTRAGGIVRLIDLSSNQIDWLPLLKLDRDFERILYNNRSIVGNGNNYSYTVKLNTASYDQMIRFVNSDNGDAARWFMREIKFVENY